MRWRNSGAATALDVLGQDVGAALEHGADLAAAVEGDRRARRCAVLDETRVLGPVGGARGAHDGDDVLLDAAVDPHARDDPLQVGHPLRIERAAQLGVRPVADQAHHGELVLEAGIRDLQLQQEAVELRLRQRIGPFVLQRVLGRQHHERFRQAEGPLADGDLPLLHRLQQRRLHLGRRAVDLVGQDDPARRPARAARRTHRSAAGTPWCRAGRPAAGRG